MRRKHRVPIQRTPKIIKLCALVLRISGSRRVSMIAKQEFTEFTRGADKSLARPGKKQATATKRGIYSTYSPRSSIHFLARCSNFCKPLKKKIRSLSVQPGLRVGRKMATFNCFFFSPGNWW